MSRDKSIQCKHIPEWEIIAACQRPRITTPDESLAHKYPVAVIMKKMERMADKRLLEYGVSLRTAWPTATGLKLLKEHRAAEPCAHRGIGKTSLVMEKLLHHLENHQGEKPCP